MLFFVVILTIDPLGVSKANMGVRYENVRRETFKSSAQAAAKRCGCSRSAQIAQPQVLQPTRNRKSNHGAETPAIKHRNGEKLAGFPPSHRASQKDSCWNRRTSFPAECQPGLSSRAKSSSLGRVRHACCCSSSVAPAGAPTVASAHADSGRASGRSNVQSGGLCEWPSGTLHMTRRGGSGGGAPLPMNPTSSGSQGLRCGERGEPPASWPSAVTLSQYQRASRLAPQRGKSTLELGVGLGLGLGLP